MNILVLAFFFKKNLICSLYFGISAVLSLPSQTCYSPFSPRFHLSGFLFISLSILALGVILSCAKGVIILPV